MMTSPTRTRALPPPSLPGWVALLATLLLGASLISAGATPVRAADDASTAPDFSARGPYEVETSELVVTRAGSDETFEARLFVPLPPADGTLAPDERSATYAFGHGYLSPVEPYESTLEHLATWGITVVAPRSGSELFPSHERFAGDLLSSHDAVAAAAEAAGWAGLPVDVDARAVGGHSMGGGAAVLAAAMDPGVRAVATLTAADTRPSAVEAAAGVDAPMLLVAGSEDRITPVDAHQRPIYEAAAGPAQLRIMDGGGHCGFLDQGDLIGLVCGRSSLDAETQRTYGKAVLTAWLRGETMDDADARTLAWGPDPSGIASVETRGLEPA